MSTCSNAGTRNYDYGSRPTNRVFTRWRSEFQGRRAGQGGFVRIGRGILEACQEGPADVGGWLAQLAPRLGRDLGYPVAMGVNDIVSMGTDHFTDPFGAFPFLTTKSSPDFYEAAGRIGSMSQSVMFSLLYRPFRTTSAARQFGHLMDVAQVTSIIAPGHENVACLRADLGRHMLVANVALRGSQTFPVADRRVLRLQRHLAGAISRRMRASWHESAIVVNTSGRVEHCDVKPPPRPMGARELTSLFARELNYRTEPDEDAERLWDALWEGGWAVARVDDTDGRRYLTLRRNATEPVRVSPHERAVLALARQGRALQWIAAELGISISTASAHLQSGLNKLGLSHRLELEKLAPRRAPGAT